MAQTAIVNPRRKRRRRRNEPEPNPRRRRRRRHYGAMAYAPVRRRRRRRNPELGEMADLGKRTYTKRVYRRRRNPDGALAGDFGALMEVAPPATAGVIGARWAVKMAGEME